MMMIKNSLLLYSLIQFQQTDRHTKAGPFFYEPVFSPFSLCSRSTFLCKIFFKRVRLYFFQFFLLHFFYNDDDIQSIVNVVLVGNVGMVIIYNDEHVLPECIHTHLRRTFLVCFSTIYLLR